MGEISPITGFFLIVGIILLGLTLVTMLFGQLENEKVISELSKEEQEISEEEQELLDFIKSQVTVHNCNYYLFPHPDKWIYQFNLRKKNLRIKKGLRFKVELEKNFNSRISSNGRVILTSIDFKRELKNYFKNLEVDCKKFTKEKNTKLDGKNREQFFSYFQ